MNSNPTTFTRLQALTLAAVILFALALLFPMTTTARSGGKSALCMANLHLLGRAWTAYQEDNNEWLAGLSNYYAGTRSTPYRWVERPLFRDTDNPESGVSLPSDIELNLEYQLNGVRAGKLFAYTENEQVYHCPNDKYWMIKREGPWISYSGSGLMNSEDFYTRNGMTITEFRTVTLPSGQSKQLVCVNKFSQIKIPASRFTFVEEDYANPLGKNQPYQFGGYVMMGSSNYWSWWDWPAWYHEGRSTLGFADGHAEIHVWQDQRTLDLMRTGSFWSGVQPDNADIVYVNNGYVPAGW